ncbi:hypothetical protein Q1695_005698 [Nippostrongylus brasiliensis]|nr:hypothetical protein Q1695_005698 [Nippostrongylus brasiliensis]
MQAQTVPGLQVLHINDIIANWKVEEKLGEGGFGAVYKVSDVTSPSHPVYALKTERVNSQTKVLKMEVVVLRALKKARATHCCDILDSGRALGYNFIIMTLVGSSLMELRKNNKVKQNAFSMGCALSIGLQTLEAIQELHNVGYLHRDLKPANFAICLDDVRKICLLDFGMCRRYIDSENAVRRPRWASGFRGTKRYAAISCHISREMARKDDLESWLYQQIEFTSGELPWKSLEDSVAICNLKEKARTEGLTQLFAGCPKEYIHIMLYIDSLRYYDKPHYAVIRGLLRDALNSNNLSEFPYDWEPTAGTPKNAAAAAGGAPVATTPPVKNEKEKEAEAKPEAKQDAKPPEPKPEKNPDQKQDSKG